MTDERLIEEAVTQALSRSDDQNHEDLCHCGLWPDSCVTYGDRKPWSHDAESVARDAALAVFEKAHTPNTPTDDDRDVSAHVEAVAYADDIAEGGDPVPEDYERHYCEEDGEDWPCATIRTRSELIPGEPFTLEELARQHEKIGETWSLMAQTVPAFHTMTAKALRWAALRAASATASDWEYMGGPGVMYRRTKAVSAGEWETVPAVQGEAAEPRADIAAFIDTIPDHLRPKLPWSAVQGENQEKNR